MIDSTRCRQNVRMFYLYGEPRFNTIHKLRLTKQKGNENNTKKHIVQVLDSCNQTLGIQAMPSRNQKTTDISIIYCAAPY